MGKEDLKEYFLHEYDKCYDLFKMHYEVSDQLSKNYFMIVGGMISLLSLFYNKIFGEYFSIFNLTLEMTIIVAGVCILMSIVYMIFIEHKIKTIYYVRVLNNIRKYFYDIATLKEKQYILFAISKNELKYFVLFKDFFWNMTFFSVFNSFAFFVLFANILKGADKLILSLIVIPLGIIINLSLYWFRGKMQKQ
jgi:hypothetical protein